MPQEMDGVRHYLVDELEPFEEFHVVRFQEMARAAMKEIRSRGHIPILVGGTGFYIQAVVRDIDFTENEASPYRAELEALAEEKGSTWLHEELRKVDPESCLLYTSYNCPHGRPTIISMSKYELEKKFKRIV